MRELRIDEAVERLAVLTPLNLEECVLIAHGWRKKVFYHPEAPELCFKVQFLGPDRDFEVEMDYRRSHRKSLSRSLIAERYYGYCPIKYGGTAHVYARIRDFDGNTSQTLEEYIATHRPEETFAVMEWLRDQLKRDTILSKMSGLQNIMVQRTDAENFRVRIVDEIGFYLLINLPYYFNLAAKAYTWHYYRRLVDIIGKECPGHFTHEQMEQLKKWGWF